MLELALVRFAMVRLTAAGFVNMVPLVLVRREAMFGTGFLPTDEQQIFRTADDHLYLAGTSEVPLVSLPQRRAARPGDPAAALRRLLELLPAQAGSYGKDTRGIFRVHQFDKVEMVSFVLPEDSAWEHELLLAREEEILQALELPYRVVDIAAGDLGGSAARKFDCEAWIPSQGTWRELTLDLELHRLPGPPHRLPGQGARRQPPPAHPQRHRRGRRPHHRRPAREPPAARRLGPGPRRPPRLPGHRPDQAGPVVVTIVEGLPGRPAGVRQRTGRRLTAVETAMQDDADAVARIQELGEQQEATEAREPAVTAKRRGAGRTRPAIDAASRRPRCRSGPPPRWLTEPGMPMSYGPGADHRRARSRLGSGEPLR